MIKIRVHKAGINETLANIGIISFISMTPIIALLSSFGVNASVYKIIMGILCYGTVALFFLKNPSRIPKDFILLVLLVLIFYCITCIVHPEYISTIKPVMWGHVISLAGGGILSYVYPRLFMNINQLKKCILIAALINFIHYTILGINVFNVGYWVVIDEDGIIRHHASNMDYGYQMLFCFTVFVYYAHIQKTKKSLLYYALAAFSVFEIVFLGSRGAFFSALATILMFYLASRRGKARNVTIGLSSFGIILMLGFIIFKNVITNWVSNMMSSIGYNSRFLDMAIGGSLLDDNGRATIASRALQFISDSIFTGNGMLSDRYLIGTYCHNIFLEILFDFGIVIGLPLISWLTYKIVKYIRNCTDEELLLFIAFFSVWVTRLLVSYSFWMDIYFWMSIALLHTKFYRDTAPQTIGDYENVHK